ncbi:MAG: GAF domain-containing protein, partial [Chloroflexota bacterium]
MNKLIQDQLTQQYGSLKDVPPDVLKLMKSISDSFDQTEIEVADENNQRLDTRGQQVQQTNAIAQVIISSKDIGQLYRNVVKAVQEKLSFDYVQLFRFNAGLESLSLVAGTGTAGTNLLNKGYKISLNNIGYIGKAATKQATVFIPNTAQDPTWVATPQIQETKSEISTPILLGGELLGVLNAQSNQLNTLSVDTQLVLEVLSGQIAVAIESLRLRTEMEEHIRELDALQRITSNEGWDNFRDTGSSQSQAYSFDGSTSEPQQVPNPAAKALSITSKPMAVRGEVIGAIGIKDDPDNPLNEEEQNLLESITEEVAEALERARLFESSQRSAAELKILNDMGNAFTESLNELAIVENIYIYAARLFPVEEFFVALYEKEDNMVTFPLAMHQGKRVDENHPNWNHWQPREPGIGLTGHIIREHMPILIENNAEKVLTDLNIPFESHGDLTQSWLGVPMALGDRLLGVISAQ